MHHSLENENHNPFFSSWIEELKKKKKKEEAIKREQRGNKSLGGSRQDSARTQMICVYIGI
jgi:hypothetical protein